jgi:hypothetical protein
MTALRLAWDITRRIALWGFAGGGVLGGVYIPLIIAVSALLATFGLGSDSSTGGSQNSTMISTFLFVSCVAGAAYGAMLGLLLGIVDGLVLAVITGLVSRSNGSLNARYRRTMGSISVIVGGLGALLGFTVIMPAYLFYALGVMGWVLRVLLPAIIAAGWGWCTGNRIASWVEHQRSARLSPATS